MMNSVLAATTDLRNMNEATKRIILNDEIIAINQDSLGRQAERKVNNKTWNVFARPLANGDVAVAVLNRGDTAQNYELSFESIGLTGQYEIRDLWEYKVIGHGTLWKGGVQSHETKVFRLRKK